MAFEFGLCGEAVLLGVDQRELALVGLLARALEGAGAFADLGAQRLVACESLADERVEVRDLDLQLAHLASDVEHVRGGLFAGTTGDPAVRVEDGAVARDEDGVGEVGTARARARGRA